MVDNEFEKKILEGESSSERDPESDREQLNVIVGDTRENSVLVTDLSGKDHEFPLEMFSNFKTAQVLKMLAAVKNKVNIPALLSEIIALTKDDSMLACPHCYNDGVEKGEQIITLFDPKRDDMLDKVMGHVGCGVCARDYYLKDAVKYTPEAKRGNKLNAAFEAIPTLMEFAPDLLVEFSALALIPNVELKVASKKPNGIAKLVEEKEDWLRFECGAHVPLRILLQSLNYIGLDLIIGELGRLDQSAAQLLTSLK